MHNLWWVVKIHAAVTEDSGFMPSKDERAMTRETKVGLLVGLGIILLVGIIVSDHLSVVQRQNPADLTHFADQTQQSVAPDRAVDHDDGRSILGAYPDQTGVPQKPTAAPRVTRPTRPLPMPARVRPSEPPRRMLAPPTPDRRVAQSRSRTAAAVPTLSQTGIARQMIGTTSSRSQAAGTDTSVDALPSQPLIHYVKTGESLWQIAQQYYGNGEFWRVVAQANPKAVGSNGSVRVGVRLVVPNKAALSTRPGDPRASADRQNPSRLPVQSATPQTGATASSERFYTVQANDSLSKIAADVLGEPDRWEDIYNANRKVLDHPDQLKVGQRLTIPPR